MGSAQGLCVAIVETLILRDVRSRRRGRSYGACAEAVAQEELFVFAIEVENLEDLGAGFLDDFFARGIGSTRGQGGGTGFDGGEAFVETHEQATFAFE